MSGRWLVTGASGMVGRDLHEQLKERGEDTVAVGHEELDITRPDDVLYVVAHSRPTVIINCAAYTKVDDCEANEDLAMSINGRGVENLSIAANRYGSILAHISTDFVFDGSASRPYEVRDRPAPISAYGRSKLAGEEAARKAERHLIIRTGWVFGVHGWNFVEAIRKQINNGLSELRVVNDQRGRPTYVPHLNAAILRLAGLAAGSPEVGGIFHYADEDEVSWYDFAAEIVEGLRRNGTLDRQVSITPVSSSEYPRPAKRPAYSVLSTERYERLTGVKPDSWREGLDEYLQLR